jgi:opacity protein-like surface antigen
MKNNVKLIQFIGAVALLLSVPLWAWGESAGVGNKGLSIGPRASYSTPNDSDSGQWSGGVQARLHVSPALGLEGSVDYRRNDFNRFTTIKTYPVQASVLAYLLPGSAVSPFLIGGTGWYHTQVNGPFDYDHTFTRFGLHAGFGLEIMLNESLSVDGTYRYVWLEKVTSRDADALDKTYQDSGSMITMALNFLF